MTTLRCTVARTLRRTADRLCPLPMVTSMPTPAAPTTTQLELEENVNTLEAMNREVTEAIRDIAREAEEKDLLPVEVLMARLRGNRGK